MQRPTLASEQYVERVKGELARALCLYDVPSVRSEHPELEYPSGIPQLSLEPVVIHKGPTESCLIESSINSARVSLKTKQSDELEKFLTKKWTALLAQGGYSEALGILRRVPVAGYDLTFLITAQHCLEHSAASLINLICHSIENCISATDLKLLISARGRAVAHQFFTSLSGS